MAFDADQPAAVAGSLSGLPSYRLHLLARRAERDAEAEYQRLFGLSLAEARVIGVCGAASAMPFRRLCQDAWLDKAQASRLVARLAGRGLLSRHGDPNDQRATVLRLTVAGRQLHAAVQAAAIARNGRWLGVLTEAQRRQFLACLELLLAQPGPIPATEAPVAAVLPAAPVGLDPDLARRLFHALGAQLNETAT